MKKYVFLLIILFVSFAGVSAEGATDLVYSLAITYENGSLEVDELSLIEGKAPDRINQPESGYELKVISFDGEVLYSFKFLMVTEILTVPPMDWFDETGEQIVIPEVSERPIITDVVLIIPYFENAKSIDIYDETGQIALSVDVSKYGKKSQDLGGLGSAIDNSIIYIIALIVVVIIGAGAFIAYKKGLLPIEVKVQTKKKEKK